MTKKKERLEFTLNPEKDSDIIGFLNDLPYQKATFIKMLIRSYIKSNSDESTILKAITSDTEKKEKKSQDILNNAFQAISSDDFNE